VARLAAGEGGPVTVSTLHEAEYLADHGFDDILYAVGLSAGKLPRLARLAARVRHMGVILDNMAAAQALVAFQAEGGPRLLALIEIDTDGHRSGLRPDQDELIEIGRVLDAAGLLDGVLTHAGESYGSTSEADLQRYAALERSGVVTAAERLRAAGLACRVVSVGSTPTALYGQDFAGVTEVRAGVYMFQDLVMAGAGVCVPADLALSVLCTVIGHQEQKGWVIVDAGWMALSRDRGTQKQRVDQGYGLVCDLDGRPIDDLIVLSANQEHGVIADRNGAPVDPARFPFGARLRILPNHACATGAQYPEYLALDGDAGIARWPRLNGW
jgi:D-serine deaminase-like pyridoxal phosphate-dependent protein